MQYYLYILISVLMIAVSFCISKKYQLSVGSSRFASAYYSFASSIATFLIFWTVDGFSLEITPFSLFTAFGAALCGRAYTFIGFKLMEYGKYSVYMTYLMVGGMVLPFLYGMLFLGESIHPVRVVGLIVLTAVVVLLNWQPSEKKNNVSAKYRLLCVAVFLLNGCVSIFSKVHQVETRYMTLSTMPYTVLSAFASTALSAVWMLVEMKNKPTGKSAEMVNSGLLMKMTPWIVLTAVVGGISSFLQLHSASFVDASILYPMITGGTIVLSALAGRYVFGEKQTKREVILTALCFAATLLFVEL